MLRLWHLDRSPFGWKVRMVLAEKRVPHDIVVPKDKNVSEEFGRLNPFRLTPVLEIGPGRVLYESTVICEYLEEAYPEPHLLPSEPWERARIRLLEDVTDQYVYPAIREYRATLFEYAPPFLVPKDPASIDRAKVDSALAKVREHLDRLERELAGHSWFGGDLVSLADVALAAPLTATLELLGVLPDAAYPRLADWARRIKARESYAASAPKEPLRIKR